VLSQVDFQAGKLSATSSAIIFEIRHVDSNGFPLGDSSPVALSKTIAVSNVPSFINVTCGQFTSVAVSSAAIHVNCGDVLALVLRSPASDSLNGYGWFQAFANFPGGNAFYRFNGLWVDLHSSSNLGFRTFVTVPEPAREMLLAIALLSTLVRRRFGRWNAVT
jgi:hypothetical protein